MSDLISRSALLEIFNHDLKCFETNGKTEAEMYISVADMRKMIEEQPIAYDKEAVVKQLENELELAEKQKEECTFKALPYYDRTEGYIVAMSNAIKIVKAGGIDAKKYIKEEEVAGL